MTRINVFKGIFEDYQGVSMTVLEECCASPALVLEFLEFKSPLNTASVIKRCKKCLRKWKGDIYFRTLDGIIENYYCNNSIYPRCAIDVDRLEYSENIIVSYCKYCGIKRWNASEEKMEILQTVRPGTVVSVHYRGVAEAEMGGGLRLPTELIDGGADWYDPLIFLVGNGDVIAGFEKGILGAEIGQKLNFSVEPEHAYGEHYPELLKIVEREKEDKIGEMGGYESCLITSVVGEKTTLDFNHPLAGKKINFQVEIAGIRPATKLELSLGICKQYVPHRNFDDGLAFTQNEQLLQDSFDWDMWFDSIQEKCVDWGVKEKDWEEDYYPEISDIIEYSMKHELYSGGRYSWEWRYYNMADEINSVIRNTAMEGIETLNSVKFQTFFWEYGFDEEWQSFEEMSLELVNSFRERQHSIWRIEYHGHSRHSLAPVWEIEVAYTGRWDYWDDEYETFSTPYPKLGNTTLVPSDAWNRSPGGGWAEVDHRLRPPVNEDAPGVTPYRILRTESTFFPWDRDESIPTLRYNRLGWPWRRRRQ